MHDLDYYEADTGAELIKRWQAERPAARTGRNLADKLEMSPATVSTALNEQSKRHAPWPLDRLDALLGLMGLSPELEDYLWLLLRRDHARSPRQRDELTLRIEAVRQYRVGRKIVSDEVKLLSSWYHLAAFELAQLQGLTADPAELGALLLPPVPATAMAEAIELNIRTGLLQRDGDSLRPVPGHVLSLPDDEEGAAAIRRAMRLLHSWYLRRATEALTEFETKERFFHADLLMVPASARDELHARVGQFHSELLLLAEQRRAEAAPTDEHQLQFVGIQVFPLSETVRGGE